MIEKRRRRATTTQKLKILRRNNLCSLWFKLVERGMNKATDRSPPRNPYSRIKNEERRAYEPLEEAEPR